MLHLGICDEPTDDPPVFFDPAEQRDAPPPDPDAADLVFL